MTDVQIIEASGSNIQDETTVTDMARDLSCVQIGNKSCEKNGTKQVESTDTPISNVSPISSESEMKMTRWLQIKDSLEGISQSTRNESGDTKDCDMKECVPGFCTETANKDKEKQPEPYILCKKPTSHISFSKIFMWDPWNKIGRRNKKEKLRKKREERHPKIEQRNRSEGPSPILRKRSIVEDEDYLHGFCNQKENESGEKYHNKSVRFQKDVNVVYFAGDQVLDQKLEPLKKETEQQERNKELRKEVCAETISGMKFLLRKSQSDYTPCWSKK